MGHHHSRSFDDDTEAERPVLFIPVDRVHRPDVGQVPTLQESVSSITAVTSAHSSATFAHAYIQSVHIPGLFQRSISV